MHIHTLPQYAALLFTTGGTLTTQLTVSEWNTLLTTVRDLGIAMLALVVLGLAIVGYIIDQRNKGRSANAENKVVSDMVAALSKVIEDYKNLVTTSETARQLEKHESTEALIPIGDAMNRLADILSEVKKQAAYANELNTKSDMKLDTLSKAYSAMSTEGSPVLREVKNALDNLMVRFDNMQCTNDEILAALKLLTDAKEKCEEKASDTAEIKPVLSLDAPPADDEPKAPAA